MSAGPAYGRPAGEPRYTGATVARGLMLASDDDRDQAVEFLKKAFTEGRLTKDDYDGRLSRVLAARTYAELDAVTADLPRPYVPPPGYPVQQRTNPLAIASLCCGVGQMVLWPLATIPAIVFGHVARHQIRRTGENGSGLALAGLLLGWAGLAVATVLLLAIVFFVVSFSHGGAHTAHPTG